MVCIWFSLFFTFRFTHLESKLSYQEHNIYLNTALLYPLLETLVKWMIVKDIIPNSWFLLNRIEHFSWAVAIVIIFLPILTDMYKSLTLWQNLIVTLGFICLVGNLNEFLEYLIRLQLNLTNTNRFAAYYPDTIYDMMMNITGGFTGFLIWNHTKQL